MDNNSFDPLELIRREGTQKKDAPKEDVQPEKTSLQSQPLMIKIIAWAAIFAIVVGFLFGIFVHPIDKLNLALLLGGSCEMKITVKNSFDSEEASLKVRGKYICYEREGEAPEYYELDGNIIYTYEKTENGEWKKVPVMGGSFAGGFYNDSLLNKDNYEKVDGASRVYRVKDAYKGTADEINFSRSGGKYQIQSIDWISVGNVKYATYTTITFEKIGGVRVTPPWK